MPDDRCANCGDPRGEHPNGPCRARRQSGGLNGILQWCGCRAFAEEGQRDPFWWRVPPSPRCTCGALDFGTCFCGISLRDFLATGGGRRA